MSFKLHQSRATAVLQYSKDREKKKIQKCRLNLMIYRRLHYEFLKRAPAENGKVAGGNKLGNYGSIVQVELTKLNSLLGRTDQQKKKRKKNE